MRLRLVSPCVNLPLFHQSVSLTRGAGGAEAEARAAADAAADAERGPPPALTAGFRVPPACVPDLLMVWEFTQVCSGCGWPLIVGNMLATDLGGSCKLKAGVIHTHMPCTLCDFSLLFFAACRHSATRSNCRPTRWLRWKRPFAPDLPCLAASSLLRVQKVWLRKVR